MNLLFGVYYKADSNFIIHKLFVFCGKLVSGLQPQYEVGRLQADCGQPNLWPGLLPVGLRILDERGEAGQGRVGGAGPRQC